MTTAQQIADTYRTILDVIGDITNDPTDLADTWWTEEGAQTYDLGCPDRGDRPALILTVEAARHICAISSDPSTRRHAIDLLRLAIDELDR